MSYIDFLESWTDSQPSPCCKYRYYNSEGYFEIIYWSCSDYFNDLNCSSGFFFPLGSTGLFYIRPPDYALTRYWKYNARCVYWDGIRWQFFDVRTLYARSNPPGFVNSPQPFIPREIHVTPYPTSYNLFIVTYTLCDLRLEIVQTYDPPGYIWRSDDIPSLLCEFEIPYRRIRWEHMIPLNQGDRHQINVYQSWFPDDSYRFVIRGNHYGVHSPSVLGPFKYSDLLP